MIQPLVALPTDDAEPVIAGRGIHQYPLPVAVTRLVRPPWRYRLLLRLVTPLLLIHLLLRGSRGGGWRYIAERLGLFTALPKGCRWVHAASVGEVLTVLPLLEALQQREPHTRILVTTTTPTGAAVLAQRAPAFHHCYLPIDGAGACRRFLEHSKPVSAWIVETEIWPWLYAFCQRDGLGPQIINARLSSRTMRASTGWLQPSYRQALTTATVLARSEEDARRYRSLGALRERISVVGNLKFGGAAVTEEVSPPISLPCCIAASTHEDEERQLAEHWLRRPQGLLVIVPRHPERGARLHAQLNAICRQAGAPACARRSHDELPGTGDRLYLADTLGELQAWFSIASAVFMGGSLVPRGGHNLLEPARQGCAIITGPHTGNFVEVVDLLEAHAALTSATDAADAVSQLVRLAGNASCANAQGRRARAVACEQVGIIDQYLHRLVSTPHRESV